jgi:hypothetical protein
LFVARRFTRLIVINLVVFAVLAEAAASFVYYIDTGRFYYLDEPRYARIDEGPSDRLTGDALHPYFGPTHTEGHPLEIPPALLDPAAPAQSGNQAVTVRANNFGFFAPFDFPFTKTRPRQFVVGILGGSVAAWFCQVGAPRLVERLRTHRYFEDRDIVTVCLGHEGYKQPQQLLLLAYFLSIGQQFDAVINIDGFNEAALAPLNAARGVDISMPSPLHLEGLVNLIDRSTLTPERLRSLAAIDRTRTQLNQLAERLEHTRLATVHVVLDRYYERIRSGYFSELSRFASLPAPETGSSLIRVTPAVRPRDAALLYADIGSEWARSSIAMNAMLTERGVPYFHVLQPNQYFSTRRFSDEERAVAFNAGSPFKSGAARGYPELVTASRTLPSGLRFFNAVDIFDKEPRPVYIDDCCHYTLVGNHLLADFIASAMLMDDSLWRGSR